MTLDDLRGRLRPPCPAIDVHVHPLGPARAASPEVDARRISEAAKRAGVEKVCLCFLHPASAKGDPLHEPTPAHCRDANDYALAMRDAVPEVFLPFCYVSPAFPDEAVAEIDRCVGGARMCGVKLWVARRATDAGLDPILRRAAAIGVPVLQHTWDKTTGNLPGESKPADVADLARRHPEAKVIMAHLNGCGLRGIEAIADCPNVSVDTAGGDPESGIVEAAFRALGQRRIVFGSDVPVRLFGACLGKVIGADLPETAKRDILWNNAARMLPEWAGVRPLE